MSLIMKHRPGFGSLGGIELAGPVVIFVKNPKQVHDRFVRVPEVLVREFLPERSLQFSALRAVNPQPLSNGDGQLCLRQIGFGCRDCRTGSSFDSAAGLWERLRRFDGGGGFGRARATHLRLRHWDGMSAACGAHFLVRLALILYLWEDSV